MNYHLRRSRIKIMLLLASAPTLFTLTFAQTSTDPATSGGDESVKLDKFAVNDVPVEKLILPTARPFKSVFGMDENIMDVPRNVTIISREQMDIINIQDVTQFNKLTTSSFTDSNFGSPANPTIRGQSADVYVNGMRQRIGESGDGMPVDFNSVESVNIIKGPATAVQGSTAYVGGIADMITKQPFFDGYHGSVGATVGSYATKRWNVDVGGPISPTLAYRVSYSGEDSDGYWFDSVKKTESFYGALTWRPNDKYQLFTFAKAFFADYSENFGINRPTQQLIDDGWYQSGININNGAVNPPSDAQNSANVKGGAVLSNTIAFGALVKINYHQRLQAPDDHAHGNEFNWQAVQTYQLNPDVQIVNNTFWSYTKRDTDSSFIFSEIVDPAWFLENRTEFLIKLPGFHDSQINTGLAERIVRVKSYDNFFFEPANVWDLSNVATRPFINGYRSTAFATSGAVLVPGWPNRYATPGFVNGDTNDSEATSVSPYFQATWKVLTDLNVVTGGRMDFMHVSANDPLTAGLPGDSLNVVTPSYNVSVVYKLKPGLSTYATYNYSQNYTGALADGGGFGQWVSGKLVKKAFQQPSELLEAGFKASVLNDHLFFSSAVFQQTRQIKPQASPLQTQLYRGIELETNYQPNKNFYATLGYSIINASIPATLPFAGYSTNQIPNGPPNPFTNAMQSTGRLRVPGQPREQVNMLASYQMDNGFGASIDGVLTGEINNDYYGYLKIPWQYQIDGSVFYRTKQWELRIEMTNITNERNWEPVEGGTYGLQGIMSLPGTQVFASAKFKF